MHQMGKLIFRDLNEDFEVNRGSGTSSLIALAASPVNWASFQFLTG
jgi:hypothetical protein